MQRFEGQVICEVMHEMQHGHRMMFSYLKRLIIFIERALMKIQKFEC